MNSERHLVARKRHWLPLPGIVGEMVRVEEVPVVDEDDNFSKATVEKFFPRQQYGFVRTDGGQRIQFNLNLVQLVGAKAEARFIKEGSRVGYDLGLTPLGPRICTLKIY